MGLTCFRYLRLKFSSPSEAARAVDTLKEYKRDGLELTIKFFAEDDSEGSAHLMFVLGYIIVSVTLAVICKGGSYHY